MMKLEFSTPIKNKKMKEKIEIAYDFYKGLLTYYSSSHPDKFRFENRIIQAKSILDAFNDNFNFEKIICIETGCSQDWDDGIFGLFFGRFVKESGGSFYSVDIVESYNQKSQEVFSKFIPGLDFHSQTIDSVEFLKNTEIVPNFVHLDSVDLDMSDPFPSALHGWEEFISIKDKMPSGSIIVIDDNYMQGTWIDWRITRGDGVQELKRYTVEYPIVGKGSHIYHWCQREDTDWNIIGDHYAAGHNIKIIIQKQ